MLVQTENYEWAPCFVNQRVKNWNVDIWKIGSAQIITIMIKYYHHLVETLCSVLNHGMFEVEFHFVTIFQKFVINISFTRVNDGAVEYIFIFTFCSEYVSEQVCSYSSQTLIPILKFWLISFESFQTFHFKCVRNFNFVFWLVSSACCLSRALTIPISLIQSAYQLTVDHFYFFQSFSNFIKLIRNQ